MPSQNRSFLPVNCYFLLYETRYLKVHQIIEVTEVKFLFFGTLKIRTPILFSLYGNKRNLPFTEDFTEEEEQKERKRMKSVNGLETQPCSLHSQLGHHRAERNELWTPLPPSLGTWWLCTGILIVLNPSLSSAGSSHPGLHL